MGALDNGVEWVFKVGPGIREKSMGEPMLFIGLS